MIILRSIETPDRMILFHGSALIQMLPASIDPKEMYQIFQLTFAFGCMFFHCISGVSNIHTVFDQVWAIQPKITDPSEVKMYRYMGQCQCKTLWLRIDWKKVLASIKRTQ